MRRVRAHLCMQALASNGSNSAHKSWSDSLKTQKDALKNHNKADSKDEKNELKTAFTKADEGKVPPPCAVQHVCCILHRQFHHKTAPVSGNACNM